MKCLYITPFKPSLKSGGEITVYNNLNILSNIVDTIDYIGLPIDKSIFLTNNLKITNSYFIENKQTVKNKLKSFFIYYDSISSYIDKTEYIVKSLDLIEYDFIFIESSRFGSLVRNISSINKNIIVNMHNVELLYFKDARTKFNYFLTKNKIYFSEKNSFLYSKYVLYLTDNELENINHIYHINNFKNFIWNPVTYQTMDNIEYNAEDRKYILFTANFTYTPNIEAAKILNKIYNIKIIIAGKNANTLNNYLDNKEIELIEFPSDLKMKELMLHAKIFLSTVKDGVGMKVKIIEAMSYNLPIIAHKNSLNGYEKSNGIISYKNFNELVKIIKQLDNSTLNGNSKKINSSFESLYSYQKVNKRYKDLIDG